MKPKRINANDIFFGSGITNNANLSKFKDNKIDKKDTRLLNIQFDPARSGIFDIEDPQLIFKLQMRFQRDNARGHIKDLAGKTRSTKQRCDSSSPTSKKGTSPSGSPYEPVRNDYNNISPNSSARRQKITSQEFNVKNAKKKHQQQSTSPKRQSLKKPKAGKRQQDKKKADETSSV